jgi:hypothetical protein
MTPWQRFKKATRRLRDAELEMKAAQEEYSEALKGMNAEALKDLPKPRLMPPVEPEPTDEPETP